MVWLRRIGLFIFINALVLITISVTSTIIFNVLGIRMSGGTQGLLIMCAIMGFSGSLISLMMSKFMAKHMMGVEIIDPQTSNADLRRLVNMTHDLARKAGLPAMPEVGIYEAPEINAFATGPSKSNSLVAVSTGLLRTMSEDEIEGVLGHEIAHISNGDMVTMTLIQGVVNTFVLFLSRVLAGALTSGDREDNRRSSPMMYWILTQVFDLLFTILASFAINYFSRLREFRADAGGARFAGRQKMIAGLRRLQSQFDNIEPDNGAGATMKISSKSSGLMALFSTHPPLSERIQRLEMSR